MQTKVKQTTSNEKPIKKMKQAHQTSAMMKKKYIKNTHKVNELYVRMDWLLEFIEFEHRYELIL